MGNRALWLLLLGLAACGPAAPIPADDDDDSAPADDDDATDPELPPIKSVTFAASLEGDLLDGDIDDGATDIQGTFHLLYWSDLEAGILGCRQRFQIGARARFGDAMQDGCRDCDGQLLIQSVAPKEEEFDDSCPPLPLETDLSFLLSPPALTVPADLRALSLVSLKRLQEEEYRIGQAGLTVEAVRARYAALGLRLEYLAMAQAGGWLDEEAGLGDVANGWGDRTLLPVLAIYWDPQEDSWGAMMEGPCFASSLWTIRLEGGAEPLPQ